MFAWRPPNCVSTPTGTGNTWKKKHVFSVTQYLYGIRTCNFTDFFITWAALIIQFDSLSNLIALRHMQTWFHDVPTTIWSSTSQLLEAILRSSFPHRISMHSTIHRVILFSCATLLCTAAPIEKEDTAVFLRHPQEQFCSADFGKSRCFIEKKVVEYM